MRSVEMVLARKPTPNTYKFAVIRALADDVGWRGFSPSDPILTGTLPEVVSFERIADCIVRYFWPIVVDYRLRQSIDPAEEPNVMRLIRDEVADLARSPRLNYWDYRDKYPERHKVLVAQCCEPDGSLVKAISRLHTVTYYRVEPRLYEVRGQTLHLDKSAVEFLVRYRRAIEQISIAYWVSFTEQVSSSPRLRMKIAEGPSGFWNGNLNRKYSRILGELWGDVCFYCGRTAREAPLMTEYFVPFNYVLQDRIWNLVLCCDGCRAAKAEQTPPDSCIKRLIERNGELLKLLQRSQVGLGNRDIHELNHFGAYIAEHLHGLVEGCRADGFGTWAGPERMPSK
jgi:5-methylcytosine-specific restriction endonuclease McrA